jgi:hypothetical protein
MIDLVDGFQHRRIGLPHDWSDCRQRQCDPVCHGARKRLPQEALGSRQVTVFAEDELDRVADAVDRSIEADPFAANPDVGLIHVPLAGHGALAPVEAIEQLRREVHDPTMHGGVIDAQAAFGHHLVSLNIALHMAATVEVAGETCWVCAAGHTRASGAGGR